MALKNRNSITEVTPIQEEMKLPKGYNSWLQLFNAAYNSGDGNVGSNISVEGEMFESSKVFCYAIEELKAALPSG